MFCVTRQCPAVDDEFLLDSAIDSHTTCPGFNTWLIRYFLPSFRQNTTIPAYVCIRHGILVWHHIGQSITATSRHRRDMTSDV